MPKPTITTAQAAYEQGLDDLKKHTYGYPRPIKPALPDFHAVRDPVSIGMNAGQAAQLFGRLERIEAKLDMLVKALAEEDEGPTHTLDGELIPADRVEGEEL